MSVCWILASVEKSPFFLGKYRPFSTPVYLSPNLALILRGSHNLRDNAPLPFGTLRKFLAWTSTALTRCALVGVVVMSMLERTRTTSPGKKCVIRGGSGV